MLDFIFCQILLKGYHAWPRRLKVEESANMKIQTLLVNKSFPLLLLKGSMVNALLTWRYTALVCFSPFMRNTNSTRTNWSLLIKYIFFITWSNVEAYKRHRPTAYWLIIINIYRVVQKMALLLISHKFLSGLCSLIELHTSQFQHVFSHYASFQLNLTKIRKCQIYENSVSQNSKWHIY